MTRIMIVAAAAVLSSLAVASAQTASGVATAPGDTATTPSDTRKIDQSQVPSSSAASPTHGPTNVQENWRSSSGLNSDPDNPSGAPRTGAGLGTSPTR
jgi:hypothetical protein